MATDDTGFLRQPPAPVWCSRRAYARLWDVPDRTIRYAIAHGRIRLGGPNGNQVNVYQADAGWGDQYAQRLAQRDPDRMSPLERAAWATVGWQWRERYWLRHGEIPDAGNVRYQLAHPVRSDAWLALNLPAEDGGAGRVGAEMGGAA